MSDILAGLPTEQWLLNPEATADTAFEHELSRHAELRLAQPLLQGHGGIFVDHKDGEQRVHVDIEEYVQTAVGTVRVPGVWQPRPEKDRDGVDTRYGAHLLNAWMDFQFPADPKTSELASEAITLSEGIVLHDEMFQRTAGRLGADEGQFPITNSLGMAAGLLHVLAHTEATSTHSLEPLRTAVAEAAKAPLQNLQARTLVVNHETPADVVEEVEDRLALPRPLRKYQRLGWSVLLQETPWAVDRAYDLAFVRPTVEPKGWGPNKVVSAIRGYVGDTNRLPYKRLHTWVVENDEQVDRITNRPPVFDAQQRSHVVRVNLTEDDVQRGVERDFRVTSLLMRIAGAKPEKAFRKPRLI